MFCRNIGKKDKMVRLVMGLGMIALGIYFRTWWGAIGIVPILSAALGHCPMVALCGGISTCSDKEGKAHEKGGCCDHSHAPH